MTNPKVTTAMQWNVEGDVHRAVFGALGHPWFKMGVVHDAVYVDVRRAVNRGVGSAVELAAYWSDDLCALQDYLRETKSSWKGRG
jgi:hypothetical protein